MILFGILTFGIYPAVIWSRLTGEVNLVASRYDGKRSMPFFGMVLLMPLTMGIHFLVWINKLCSRIGCELQRRNIPYTFAPSDFWLWSFLLSRKFVFTSAAERAVPWHRALIKMYVVYGITGVGLSTLLAVLWVRVLHIPKEIVTLINDILCFPITFLLNKYWAFAKKKP